VGPVVEVVAVVVDVVDVVLVVAPVVVLLVVDVLLELPPAPLFEPVDGLPVLSSAEQPKSVREAVSAKETNETVKEALRFMATSSWIGAAFDDRDLPGSKWPVAFSLVKKSARLSSKRLFHREK
jgi:hypothetical protein